MNDIDSSRARVIVAALWAAASAAVVAFAAAAIRARRKEPVLNTADRPESESPREQIDATSQSAYPLPSYVPKPQVVGPESNQSSSQTQRKRRWLPTLILTVVTIVLSGFAATRLFGLLTDHSFPEVYWYKGDRISLFVPSGYPISAAGIQLSMSPGSTPIVIVNLKGLSKNGKAYLVASGLTAPLLNDCTYIGPSYEHQFITGQGRLDQIANLIGNPFAAGSTVVELQASSDSQDDNNDGNYDLFCAFGEADDVWYGGSGSYALYAPRIEAVVAASPGRSNATVCASEAVEILNGEEFSYTYPERSPNRHASESYSEYIGMFPDAGSAYYGSGGPQGELAEWNSCSSKYVDGIYSEGQKEIDVESHVTSVHVDDSFDAQRANRVLFISGVVIGIVGNLLVELLSRLADRFAESKRLHRYFAKRRVAASAGRPATSRGNDDPH